MLVFIYYYYYYFIIFFKHLKSFIAFLLINSLIILFFTWKSHDQRSYYEGKFIILYQYQRVFDFNRSNVLFSFHTLYMQLVLHIYNNLCLLNEYIK